MNIESAVNIDDSQVISGSVTGELWCWDLVSGQVIHKLSHTGGKVLNSVDVHPTKDLFLTSSVNTIKIWARR